MPSAVKLWQTALAQLQQLPTVRQEAGFDGSSFPLPTVQEFLTSTRSNFTVWKRLVKELQVPLHLGQAVASATDPFTPKAYAAISAVSVLLQTAMADDILITNVAYTAGILVANCTHTAGSLASSIGRQLQQSGFMAALPGLLAAAAAALKDTQHEPGLAYVPQHSSCVFVGSLADMVLPSSRSSHPLFADSVSRVMHAQAVVGLLLEVLSSCNGCWPHLLDTAAVFLPALQLCAATMQHCSRCADLVSPASPAPTGLEQLMYAACSVVQSRQPHCSPCWRQEDPAALASSAGHPAALQALCMVLLAFTLCPQWFECTDDAVTADSTASTTASSTAPRLRIGTPLSINASHAAWQYACSHQSELSQLQQQMLQELNCGSGRALMFVSQHRLSFVDAADLKLVTDANLRLALHGLPLPQLDQPQEVQQFAEALAQLKEGGSPPCGSRLLPCASLLWLVPAVLLEGLQKQLAVWADADWCSSMLNKFVWRSLRQVQREVQFWGYACDTMQKAAAAQPAGAQQGQQGQQATAADSMLTAAGRVAREFGKAWEPSTPLLVQLLHLTSSAAARLSARMQYASWATMTEGSSSSSGGGSTSGRGGDSSRGRNGHQSVSSLKNDGQVQQVPTDTDISADLYSLFMAQLSLFELVNMNLWVGTHNAAAFPGASSSFADGDTSPGTESGDTAPGPEQQLQASLTSLCAAVQPTQPQLASLAEVVLRRVFQGRFTAVSLQSGGCHMRQLLDPGLFIAASAQPGSSAAKALCSLSFTLLKLANATTHAEPPPDKGTAMEAAICLWSVVLFTSVFVKAACTGWDRDSLLDTYSRASEVMRVLCMADFQRSGAVLVSNPWGAGPLSLISSAASAASTSSNSSSSQLSDSDAVALVPWLVSLGRCCMAYAFFLQTGGTILPQEAAQASLMEPLRDVAAALHVWLQSGSVSAQLAAAGYSTQPVIRVLQYAVEAGQDAAQAGATVALPPELLQQLGLALSNLPIGTACNNVRCSSLDGLSEQQLVVGKARLCAGCRVARYCCRACQVAAWKQHKPACKALAGTHAAKCADQPA